MMARILKSEMIALLVALVIGVSIWPVSAARLILPMQDAELTEVASGPLGEPTLALNGRGDFTPESIVLYGYVSAVGGLGKADLFAGDTVSAESARFTFVADLAVDSITNRADVTVSAASGPLRVYFNEAAGANLDDRESFAAGQPVGEYSLDLRDTLHRQAPGVGLVVGSGRLMQTAGEEFALGDEQFRFGFADLAQGLRYVGALVPGTQAGQTYAVGFTGKMAVTGREAIIARVGDPESVVEEATPAAEGDVCAQLEPWLSETVGRLGQVEGIAPETFGDGSLESLDGAALQQIAGEVAALVAAQRETTVPAQATAANRLTVTALSTYARGLQLFADAASAQDADLLAQGEVALNDGASLLARARGEVDAISPGCSAGLS